MDVTDFHILEPHPFSPKWFSHKFKGPGLGYEICVCIQTGDIAWWNGSFAAGEWPDLSIARYILINMLDEDEMAVADGAYCDGFNYFPTPTGLNNLLK